MVFQGRKPDVQSESQPRLLGCRLGRCRLVPIHTRTNPTCDFTKKASKLRTALECISSRAITITNFEVGSLQAFPRSHSIHTLWKRKNKCRTKHTVTLLRRTERPNRTDIKNEMQMHDWCRECCASCWGVHGDMGIREITWEHAMGHVRTSHDSPAAGATRYGHNLAGRLVMEKEGCRTRLCLYISRESAKTMLIETLGRALVKPRRRYHNFYYCRSAPLVPVGFVYVQYVKGWLVAQNSNRNRTHTLENKLEWHERLRMTTSNLVQ